eukprot:SAG31_NODE_1127_length_9758_cov_2.771301_9_plen_331_part_00
MVDTPGSPVENQPGLRKYWGEEIKLRGDIERELCSLLQIPMVTVVVAGGPGTLSVVLEAIRNRSEILVVRGSGGAADAIALSIAGSRSHPFVMEYERSLNPDFKKTLREICNVAALRPNAIRVFHLDTDDSKPNLGHKSNVSSELVECALERSQKGIFAQIDIAIRGNRCDLLQSIILKYHEVNDASPPLIVLVIFAVFLEGLFRCSSVNVSFSCFRQHATGATFISVQKLLDYALSKSLRHQSDKGRTESSHDSREQDKRRAAIVAFLVQKIQEFSTNPDDVPMPMIRIADLYAVPVVWNVRILPIDNIICAVGGMVLNCVRSAGDTAH